jgi:hypothetical protein
LVLLAAIRPQLIGRLNPKLTAPVFDCLLIDA